MTTSLYHIPLELERVLATEMEDGTPVDVEEQYRRIKEFLSSSKDAIEQAIEFTKHLKMEVGEIDKRVQSLKKKKEAREATIERIESELLSVIDQVFNGKIKMVEWSAFGRDNKSYPVEVADETKLSAWPKQFVKESIAPDTAAIRQAFKEGTPLPEGASCRQVITRSLVIR